MRNETFTPMCNYIVLGLLPLGGGEVIFKCPIKRQTRPVQLLDGGMVKRIRGTAFALRVSPSIANRIVEKAKGVLLEYLPDVYINTDQCRGKQSGKSPGFGIHLVAETNNEVFYSAEQVGFFSLALHTYAYLRLFSFSPNQLILKTRGISELVKTAFERQNNANNFGRGNF